MARKTATIRVHEIATQLGVTSKDVVAKCQAEDIPNVTNHMSAISAGLAATICEWFTSGGDGGVATAVEIAEPVDVERARAKATRKASKKAPRKPVARKPKAMTEIEAEEAVTEIEETAAKVEQPTDAVRALEVLKPEPELTPPVQAPETAGTLPPVEAPKETGKRPAAAAKAPERPARREPEEKAKPVMNVPQRPKSIAPAGPKLQQPVKTKLAGPKVIRVESPEAISQPRTSRRTDGPIGRGGPRAGRGAGFAPTQPTEPPMPGRGGRAAPTRRNKRRTASSQEEGGRGGRAFQSSSSQSPDWREQDLKEREQRLARAGGYFKAHRRDNLKKAHGGGHRASTPAQSGGQVKVSVPITVKDFSAQTGIKTADIIKQLFLSGKPVTINSSLDAESVLEIAASYNIELEIVEQKTAEEEILEQFAEREVTDSRPRSPVITILGHVDHGKTSLLDKIRNTNVAAGEAGGITQATSAFQIPVHAGDKQRMVTFIDTPGHEAFTEMRARGAKITDVVVLVVAADDGVMPQTIESINHAKAAGVPIVVALNKIDKPEATDTNIQRILGQLAQHELNPVDWGGSTEVVRTSATRGDGIQDILEILDYQAELLDLKADFGGRAEGTVIEAQLREGRGAVANILVQQGRLKKGDCIVAGRAYGRVRDIINDRGERIDEALPSAPVAISGLDEVPKAGDKFYVVADIKAAEASAMERRAQAREKSLARERVTLDNIFQKLSESGTKELPLIVKADVQGSVDTLNAVLEKISTDEVKIAIKHSAVGGINDSDILLAEATGAIVIGFNVTASAKARRDADAKGVDIRLYDVIYDLTDDVTKAAEGLLEPEHKLEVLGHAEVRQVFKISRVGMIAGCYVTDGVIERNAQIRVTRNDIVIEKDRRLEQLKRFKDDAKEVRAGQECGMKIDGYDDIKVGDVLECYKTTVVRRTL